MNLPKVSIILPTYNRVDSLKECIQSVIDQNYQNWELIIVDDSSTKDVEKFIKPEMRKESRIKYHKNKNRKGLPGSRNVGITLSNEELILFIEDDIIVDTKAFERLITTYNKLKLQGKKIGAITPSRPWIFPKNSGNSKSKHALLNKNEKLKVPSKRSKFTGIIYSNFVPKFKKLQEVPDVHSCSLYPRIVLKEVRGYDEQRYDGNFLYEEEDLNYRIYKEKYKFYFEPRAILYHIMTNEGGCRVSTIKYGYFFVRNHIRYVTKNFRSKSIYMLPFFFSFIILIGIKLSFNRTINAVRR